MKFIRSFRGSFQEKYFFKIDIWNESSKILEGLENIEEYSFYLISKKVQFNFSDLCNIQLEEVIYNE